MTTIETQKIKNIHDKDQLYIVMKNGTEKVIINVGNKTYEAVNKLIMPQNEKENKKEAKK